MKLKTIAFCLTLLVTQFHAYPQITTNSIVSPTSLANTLMGGSVQVSNVSYKGCNSCRGTFNGLSSNLGIGSGVMVATGNVNVAIGPNNSDRKFSGAIDNPNTGDPGGEKQPGDAQLTQMLGGITTFDASVLEFDFVAPSTQLTIPYVFASEEYPEFVCSEANDVFAIFISGPGITGSKNLTVIPGTNTNVTINNVNSGDNSNAACTQPATPPCTQNCVLSNSQYFVVNGDGTSPQGAQQIQYDGFTVVLEANSPLICGETYHLKIAIADAWDGVWDSGLFLKDGVFDNAPAAVTPPDLGPDISSCSQQSVTLDAGSNQPGVSYLWSTGLNTQTIDVTQAGTYWVEVTNGLCTYRDEINISLSSITASTSVTLENACDRFGGTLGNITTTPSGGTQPYTYLWNDPLNQTSATATGLSVGTYTVTVTDNAGCVTTVTDTIKSKIQVSINLDTPPSCTSCADGSLSGAVSGTGNPPFTYRWDDTNEQTTSTATGLTEGVYVLIVTDADGCFSSDTLTLELGVPEGIETYSDPLEIYPNPNNGAFTVNLPGREKGNLIIFDTRGKMVSNQVINSGKNTLGINLEYGIYFLDVITEEYTYRSRLLITN